MTLYVKRKTIYKITRNPCYTVLVLRNVTIVTPQALDEFYANAGKLGPAPTLARSIVESYAEWRRFVSSLAFVQCAWHWLDHAGLVYWGALILAAAGIH